MSVTLNTVESVYFVMYTHLRFRKVRIVRKIIVFSRPLIQPSPLRRLTVPHKSTSANLAYLCWVWRDGETRCFFGVTFLVDGRVADSNDVIDHARIA